MHLSESQLLFLARFSKSPEGKEFTRMLEQELAEVSKKLRVAEGPEMHRQQGRAQQVDDLLLWITDANRKLNTIQSARNGPRRIVLSDELAQ